SIRRRHTRSDRDWSSDVCSSDLIARHQGQATFHAAAGDVHEWAGFHAVSQAFDGFGSAADPGGELLGIVRAPGFALALAFRRDEIGRASCWDGVEYWGAEDEV